MTTLHKTRLMRADLEGITWREYVDWRFNEWDKRNDQVRAVLVTANDREKAALEARLDGLNHLQRRIDTLVGTLASQGELRLAIDRVVTENQAESRRILAEVQAVERRQEVIQASIDERVVKLERFQARLQGQILMIGVLASGLAIFMPFIVKALLGG